jgi:hypothetical protein
MVFAPVICMKAEAGEQGMLLGSTLASPLHLLGVQLCQKTTDWLALDLFEIDCNVALDLLDTDKTAVCYCDLLAWQAVVSLSGLAQVIGRRALLRHLSNYIGRAREQIVQSIAPSRIPVPPA